MKRSIKVLKLSLPAALSLAAFVFVTSYYFRENFCFEGPYFEKICYGVWCVSTGVYFSALAKRIKGVAVKLTAAFLTSGIFTAAVFFANNFWTYICFNGEYSFDYHVPYFAFLKQDILYNFADGEFRYPLVFAIMLAVCIFTVFRVGRFLVSKLGICFDCLAETLYDLTLSLESLEELYCDAVGDEADNRLNEYVSRMPVNQSGKKEMMDCIDKYNDPKLIELLFSRFGGILEIHEYTSYRKRYLMLEEKRINELLEQNLARTARLPESCRALDERFGIE